MKMLFAFLCLLITMSSAQTVSECSQVRVYGGICKDPVGLDIVFVVDSDQTASDSDWLELQSYMTQLVAGYTNLDEFSFGLVSFGSSVQTSFSLQSTSVSLVNNILNSLSRINGASATSFIDAINTGLDMLEAKTDVGQAKAIVIFVDAETLDNSDVDTDPCADDILKNRLNTVTTSSATFMIIGEPDVALSECYGVPDSGDAASYFVKAVGYSSLSSADEEIKEFCDLSNDYFGDYAYTETVTNSGVDRYSYTREDDASYSLSWNSGISAWELVQTSASFNWQLVNSDDPLPPYFSTAWRRGRGFDNIYVKCFSEATTLEPTLCPTAEPTLIPTLHIDNFGNLPSIHQSVLDEVWTPHVFDIITDFGGRVVRIQQAFLQVGRSLNVDGTWFIGTSFTTLNVTGPAIACDDMQNTAETVSGHAGYYWLKCDFGGQKIAIPPNGKLYSAIHVTGGYNFRQDTGLAKHTSFYYQNEYLRTGYASFVIQGTEYATTRSPSITPTAAPTAPSISPTIAPTTKISTAGWITIEHSGSCMEEPEKDGTDDDWYKCEDVSCESRIFVPENSTTDWCCQYGVHSMADPLGACKCLFGPHAGRTCDYITDYERVSDEKNSPTGCLTYACIANFTDYLTKSSLPLVTRRDYSGIDWEWLGDDWIEGENSLTSNFGDWHSAWGPQIAISEAPILTFECTEDTVDDFHLGFSTPSDRMSNRWSADWAIECRDGSFTIWNDYIMGVGDVPGSIAEIRMQNDGLVKAYIDGNYVYTYDFSPSGPVHPYAAARNKGSQVFNIQLTRLFATCASFQCPGTLPQNVGTSQKCDGADAASCNKYVCCQPSSCNMITGVEGGSWIDPYRSVIDGNKIIIELEYPAIFEEVTVYMDHDHRGQSPEHAPGGPWNVTTDVRHCFDSIKEAYTFNRLQEIATLSAHDGNLHFYMHVTFEYPVNNTFYLANGEERYWIETVEGLQGVGLKLEVPDKTSLPVSITALFPSGIEIISAPTTSPTTRPTTSPTTRPTASPITPTTSPSSRPTTSPSPAPSPSPTSRPTTSPTTRPTRAPTTLPTTSPTTKPTPSPTSRPTVSPTTRPTESPTTIPSTSPTTRPTRRPTTSPTTRPTSSPLTEPTPSPTTAPTPEAKIMFLMLTAHAQEWHPEPNSLPLVSVDFVTVVNNPYRLYNPMMTGEGVQGQEYSELTRAANCNQWSTLEIHPEFFNEDYYCQEWYVEFYHERKCDTDRRDIIVYMNATNPTDPDAKYDLDPHWLLSFGYSSAFECAHDLGMFEVAVDIDTSLDGVTYTDPQLGWLNERFYFQMDFASGDPITGVVLEQITIEKQNGIPLCSDCINDRDLDIRIISDAYDDFRFDMNLNEAVFGREPMVNFVLEFSILRDAAEIISGGRRLSVSTTPVELQLAIQIMPKPPSANPATTTKEPTILPTYSSPTNGPTVRCGDNICGEGEFTSCPDDCKQEITAAVCECAIANGLCGETCPAVLNLNEQCSTYGISGICGGIINANAVYRDICNGCPPEVPTYQPTYADCMALEGIQDQVQCLQDKIEVLSGRCQSTQDYQNSCANIRDDIENILKD